RDFHVTGVQTCALPILVPETTMAQRISRAKRTVTGVRFTEAGDVGTVVRVLYLIFNEGYSGDVDLAAEAIRLTRQLARKTPHEEDRNSVVWRRGRKAAA